MPAAAEVPVWPGASGPGRSERVLQICHGYTGPFLDVARQYSDVLARSGYEVHTVYLTGLACDEVAAATGSGAVHFLELGSREIAGLKLGAIRSIREITRHTDFRFCVAHRFKPAYIACLATNLPIMAVFHAYATFDRLSRRAFARLFQSRLLILGVSDAIRDDIRSKLAGWSRVRVEAFHNRIDVEGTVRELYSREEARRLLEIERDAFVVANVGRLHPDKDQATLLRGFALARDRLPRGSRLLIIGSGRLENALRELAASLGIGADVVWGGQMPEAKRYFRAFDVFALSSDHEPFGMVLLEAMVAGIPIVATNAGGVPEILGEGFPFLVPLADAGALGAALGNVAEMQQADRAALVARLKERLEGCFSYHAATARFTELKAALPAL